MISTALSHHAVICVACVPYKICAYSVLLQEHMI